MSQKPNNDDFLLPFMVLSELEKEDKEVNNEPGANFSAIIAGLLALLIVISCCSTSAFMIGW